MAGRSLWRRSPVLTFSEYTSTVMSIELLRMTSRDERAKAVLSTIETSAKRGADMVKQILSFARGVEGERIVINIRHVIEDMQHLVHDTFPKEIVFRAQLDKELPLFSGDHTQVHQVLLNLCVNARDAMPKGGILTVTALNPLTASMNAVFENNRTGMLENYLKTAPRVLWLRQGDGHNQIVIRAVSRDRVDGAVRLKGVSLFIFSPNANGLMEFSRRIEASEARLTSGFWRLTGVREASILRNDYFDGPFDQLADNYAAQVPLRQTIGEAFPGLKDQIDLYGYFTSGPDAGNRVALTSYLAYSSTAGALAFTQKAIASADPIAAIAAGGKDR